MLCSARTVGLSVGLSLAISLAPGMASAAIVNVASEAELLAAIAAAQAGDEIVLADGNYALTGASCNAQGTLAAPIVVRAQNPLGASIAFDGLEGFKVAGAHWHFEGLDVVGVCPDDSDCEHAFHVFGAADGFVLRNSRVRDFNAQLKVNAQNVGGTFRAPNDGLIEGCDIFDSDGRQTSNPVTKLNIDGGLRWQVRGNYLHDFEKAGGNTISYGAFMKSGGADGVFERNLVVCASQPNPQGARIGLSFGGGGTAPQFCAPAYDANTPCNIEHTGGIMRNNIIASCSDVGIYLNRAADSTLLFNTLIATSGIDFRFDTTTGLAHGNLVSGPIRDRDGGSHSSGPNLLDVSQASFDAWYAAPLTGDLSIIGDVSALVGQATPQTQISDDYCERQRPASGLTLGALEHSLGDCDIVPPTTSGAGGGATASVGNGAGTGTASGPSGSGGAGTGGAAGEDGGSEDGCGCRFAGDEGAAIAADDARSGRSGSALGASLGLLGLLLSRRRRRTR